MIWNEILCLGDSITYGARDKYGRSPTIELSRILTDETGEVYICHNHGVSGDTSTDLLRRSWNAIRSHKECNIAMIMIGTNDTQKNIPIEIYRDNLIQIINMCKIHGMHVIISTLPPLGFTPLYYKNSHMIDCYNKVIKKLKKRLDIDICDMSGIEKYYVDGVHFTNVGNRKIAERWACKILESQT